MIKQVGGDHYEYGEGDQHWDLMDRWDIEYLVATATKYIVRYDRKGTPRLDLEKSISYVEKQLACHPNKGCRRTIALSALSAWYDANQVSERKKLVLKHILVHGEARDLRRAINMMKEIINAEYSGQETTAQS